MKEIDMPYLPEAIMSLVEGFTFEIDEIGRSESKVYRVSNENTVYFLKTGTSIELLREANILRWLKGRVPVPEVVSYVCERPEEGSNEKARYYILMTAAPGIMVCENITGDENEENRLETVRVLAEGIKLMQGIDISECPFDRSLNNELAAALYNIENNLVDMDDFAENSFKSPVHLYNYLCDNRFPEELCFSHGDFCLPNIFKNNGRISSFIDLGRGGIADKWQDIALCVRSLRYNFSDRPTDKYVDLFFEHLGIEPNEKKIEYYILMDELF